MINTQQMYFQLHLNKQVQNVAYEVIISTFYNMDPFIYVV